MKALSPGSKGLEPEVRYDKATSSCIKGCDTLKKVFLPYKSEGLTQIKSMQCDTVKIT